MGYSTSMAAALSGVTTGQLRDWRRNRERNRGGGPILRPAPTPGPALYSFEDVLALRAFARLGRGVPLRRIREAFTALEDPGPAAWPSRPVQLSAFSLVADGDAVVLARSCQVAGPRARRRRTVLTTVAGVLGEFTPRAGVVVPHLLRPRFHVTVDPGTQSGLPVIAGTRVPFDAVADLVDDGVPPERITEHYPGVSAEAARDATSFARYVNSYRTPRAV
ncbi:DUF433 domain-containing protein [Streptantibioticus silvisoli]|uniref:DUF433 domain-containing protein n=1 Tax=Streptantibioticus silvisoli TaxID=2705255 RepID=A0ABT6VWH6_9ACTN|nr:DUF433 domain-containing protein [Streptantibioticus silvisoli]MDI5962843.1 DUF433 domain-containing protein [Streptantibioticus silvisoli]